MFVFRGLDIRSLHRSSLAIGALVVVFCFGVIGCAWDSPPEDEPKDERSVSLSFDEDQVPGPATSVLVAEASAQPEYAPTHVWPRPEGPSAPGAIAGGGTAYGTNLDVAVVPVVPPVAPKRVQEKDGWNSLEGRATPKDVVARTRAEKTGTVEVTQSVTCSTVVNRRPKDPKKVFTLQDDKIWVWLQLKNSGGPTHVNLVWKMGEETRWRVSLKVGRSKRWRTWARKSIRRVNVGDWTVEVQDVNGKVLDILDFQVRASGAGDLSQNN